MFVAMCMLTRSMYNNVNYTHSRSANGVLLKTLYAIVYGMATVLKALLVR